MDYRKQIIDRIESFLLEVFVELKEKQNKKKAE